ncbi:NNMT methyltransferase, partial [Atractosteus spatula]|nr:NNMT methyltransferase [Atractosteus spatula]
MQGSSKNAPLQSFTEGEFYQENFDSRVYVNSYYSRPTGHSDESQLLPFVLRSLSKTFSSGRYKGQRLYDVGSGPSVHTLISACEYFDEIVVSDFTDSNREEMKKWLKKEKGCFDWSYVIQFVCEMEGKRTPEEAEENLRSRVTRVLKCDVRLENPFQPVVLEPADCVLTSLCLEAACKDQDTYRQALKNVASLLRPGGVLVMIGVLNETFYVVGEHRLSCLPLTQSFVKDAVGALGFSIKTFDTIPGPDKEENQVSDFEAVFFLTAEKTTPKM